MIRNGMNAGITPAMADGYPVLEGSWSKGASLPQNSGISDMNGYGRCAQVGAKIYILHPESANTYIYDIHENSWTAAQRIPTRRNFMGCLAAGEKVYCIGGRVLDQNASSSAPVEIFDTTTNSWTAGEDMPVALDSMVCLLWQGNIFCFGGSKNPTYTTLKYEIASDKWTMLDDAPTNKFWCCSHVLMDDQVYFVNAQSHSNFEIFNLQNERWSNGPDIPTLRNANAWMAALNGKVYCISGGPTTVEYYDSSTRLWSGAASKPTASVGYAPLLQHNGKFYCLGNGTAFEVYDVASDTWYVAEDIPNNVNVDCPVFGVGNKIYCVGNMQNMEVDIFQIGDEPEHLIRVQYKSAAGKTLLRDDLRAVLEGEPFRMTAPAIAGYTYQGYTLDAGKLQSGRTANLESVTDGHVITFVYAESDGNNGGDGGTGSGNGQNCQNCGCCPCCCKKFEYARTIRTDDEEALKRLIDHIEGK